MIFVRTIHMSFDFRTQEGLTAAGQWRLDTERLVERGFLNPSFVHFYIWGLEGNTCWDTFKLPPGRNNLQGLALHRAQGNDSITIVRNAIDLVWPIKLNSRLIALRANLKVDRDDEQYCFVEYILYDHFYNAHRRPPISEERMTCRFPMAQQLEQLARNVPVFGRFHAIRNLAFEGEKEAEPNDMAGKPLVGVLRDKFIEGFMFSVKHKNRRS